VRFPLRHAGLPDGLFSNQKSQYGYLLEGLAMQNLGIFYDHLVYFTAIANIFGHLVYFPQPWYFVPRLGIFYQNLATLPPGPDSTT
jgi:hypothetical protein